LKIANAELFSSFPSTYPFVLFRLHFPR
jgi:hypothetical protein